MRSHEVQESGVAKTWRRGKNIAKLAVALSATIGAYDLLSHFPGIFNAVPNIFQHAPANGKAAMDQNSYKLKEFNVSCSDKVTAVAGVKAHNPYTPIFNIAIGAVDINKSVPVEALVCGSGGIKNIAKISQNGTREMVTSTLPNYQPEMVGVNDLSPIMCAHGLTANATESQITSGVRKYIQASKSGHPESCDIGEKATGFIATGSTAGGADELARQLSVIAGSLQPLPAKTQNKVYQDASNQVMKFDEAQFPGALVQVNKPTGESPFQYTLSAWDQIKNEVVIDYQKVHFSHSGVDTVLNLASKAATGQVVLHEDLTNQELNTLNGSI